MYSRDSRRMMSQRWRQLFFTGSLSGMPSKYNRCYTHVDKLSSFIFSSADARFTVDFDTAGQPVWAPRVEATSRYLNRGFRRQNIGQSFSEANQISLVEGCAIHKLTWTRNGYQGNTIRPTFFGVLREDVQDLDLQEAFVHSFYVTESYFRRLIFNHPDRAELMRRVSTIAAPQASGDLMGDSYFHQIVAGSMSPIGYTGAAAAPSQGAVAISAPMAPMLAPEVLGKLIRIDELWFWNDDALKGEGDWNTIRFVEPGLLLEGKYRLRNLSDIPGAHPFTKVCSNEVSGYFWGRSEMATLYEPQQQLTNLTNDINTIWRLQAKPPRSFVGFNSVTDERARALLAPGGTITEQAVGASVSSLAPEMPQEALAYLDKLESIFDDVGGFNNILSGQGEPGVRAGVHAGTLLRTSTPRLRERALAVENQYASLGQKGLQMAQAKDASVMIPHGDDDKAYLLKQLPADAYVTVDSHTSSPAFVDDNRQVAFALSKAGAINPETLIEMLHPPREEILIDRYRKQQQAQAEWDAAHPVQAADAAKKR